MERTFWRGVGKAFSNKTDWVITPGRKHYDGVGNTFVSLSASAQGGEWGICWRERAASEGRHKPRRRNFLLGRAKPQLE